MAAWFFHAPWQTPFFGFCISSPTMGHLRWLKFWINAGRKTYIKLQKQPTSNVWPARFIILEKLFLSPEASDFPLDHLNNFNWTSFNLVRVINIFLIFSVCFLDGLKPLPATRLMPSQWQRTIRKCVSHLGYTFHNLRWSRHPLDWENYVNLDENLTNFLELSLSLSLHHQARSRGLMESSNLNTLNLLNPSGKHKVTPHETVMGRPMSNWYKICWSLVVSF